MYREMTPEEKLEFISELTEAIKSGGLAASVELVEKWKEILSTEKAKNEQSNEMESEPINNNLPEIKKTIPVGEASIYATEHLSAVQDDLMSQDSAAKENTLLESPKTRVLKNATQSLWSDSSIRLPGEPIE